MNQISQTTPPVTPITSATPDAPENAASEGEGSFDSLLQQSTDEPAEPIIAIAAEPVKPAVATDVLEAAAQAGLLVMLFAPPTILPIPTAPPEATCANPVAAHDMPSAGTPAVAPSRPTDDNTPTPIPQAARQTPPAARPAAAPQLSQPPSELLPKPVREVAVPLQDAKPLPKKEAVPTHEVANVLGIIPPVQAAPTVITDPSVFNTPTLSPKPVSVADPSVSITPSLSPKLVAVTSPSVPTSPTVSTEPAMAVEQPPTFAPAVPFRDAITYTNMAVIEPAIVAVSAPEMAPADFTTRLAQPIPVEIAAPAASAPETLSQPVAAVVSETIAVVSKAIEFTGMMAAKPGDGMSAPTLQRPQRSAPAISTEPVSKEVTPAIALVDGMQTLRPVPMPATQNERERSTDDHAENTERQPTPELATSSFPNEMAPAFSSNEVAAPIRPAEVTQVVTQTIHAAERLRASGQERVELSVRLEGGQELIIHLRMANGEVTPIIRTESEPLRIALEQNWSLFSQRGGDSELRIVTPIFESPQTSSNMSDLNQQRDQRQRAFNELAPEFFQSQNQRRNPAPNPPRPASTAPANGVSFYA